MQSLEAEVEVAPFERRQGIRHQLLTTAASLDALKNAIMSQAPA
jgi:hypothetical protein